MQTIFKTVLAVVIDIFTFFKPTSRKGLIRFVVLLAVIAGGIYFVNKNSQPTPEETKAQLPIVSVSNISKISSESTFSLLGNVASVSQADLKAEVSGRVTSVPVTLGQTVYAGTVIATFENSAAYASLLQAEGVYEAALAAAAQSDVSVLTAENSLNASLNAALSSYSEAYSILQTVYSNTLDEIFADPENTYRTPGFVPKDFVAKEGGVDSLHSDFQKKLTAADNISVNKDTIDKSVATAVADTDALISIVSLLRTLISDNDIDEAQTTTENTYLSILASVQQSLLSTKSDLENAQTGLESARKALNQAQLSGSSGEVSAANAQTKQALGALRAAQSQYNKTIVRTPIAGVINELSVKNGDYVSQQSRVALVANNDALEVTTFVGERDRDRLTIGDEVILKGGVSGTVTAIAPAVDSVTKKYEVKIASESDLLKSGDAVTITVQNDSVEVDTETTGPVLVPITAVKFSHTDGSVFTVDDGTLVSHAVTLGDVRGAFIEILEGITRTQTIVLDARGLVEGQQVEALIKK